MGCFKLHIENKPTLRVAYSKKVQKPLKISVSYYPFGLQQKGYNDVITSNKNDVAERFMFEGVELDESLGLNLYKMEMRQYDPAIARWTAIDPITHYSKSTYNAFDNNPIYWADPSGANSESLINDIWNAAGSGNTTFTNNGDGTFSGSNGASVVNEDHVVNNDKQELEGIASDLNSIYNEKYGASPFSVEKQTRTRKVLVNEAPWYKPWQDDEYKEEEYETYVLKGSIGFDWETDKYTRQLYDILTGYIK